MASKMNKKLIIFIVTIAALFLQGCSNKRNVRACQVPPPLKNSFVFVKHKATFHICGDKGCSTTGPPRSLVGSGFIIGTTSGGSIGLTAGHVCTTPPASKDGRFSSEMTVSLWGGAEYSAKIVKIIPSLDACVISIDKVWLTPLKFASTPPRHGERVYTAAAPYGQFDAEMVLVFEGFYSGRQTSIPVPGDPRKVYSVLDSYTMPTGPGSSGSPIVNSKGEVVGMTIIRFGPLENMCFSPTYAGLRSVALSAIKKR